MMMMGEYVEEPWIVPGYVQNPSFWVVDFFKSEPSPKIDQDW